MQFNKVLELGLGNVVCVMAASIILYLLFEYPFKRLVDLSVAPYLSHDDVLHLHYVRRKANSPTSVSIKARTESAIQADSGRTSDYSEGRQGKPVIGVENVDRHDSFNVRDSFD